MTKKHVYNEEDIKSIQGLAAIQHKVGLYAGSTDSNGLFTMLLEVLSNTADEFLAQRNDTCYVHVSEEGVYTVSDYGEGIPVKPITIDMYGTQLKMPAIQAIFSVLHSGGKLTEGKAYKEGSIGSHGIGCKLTTALSKRLDCWTKRSNQVWHLAFENGKLVTELEKSSFPIDLTYLKRTQLGTVIRFTPDLKYFDSDSEIKDDDIKQWCKITSNINAGFRIGYVNPEGDVERFFSQQGISAFLRSEMATDETITDIDDIHFEYKSRELDIAMVFTNGEGVKISGYTNGLHNIDGGVHVNAVSKLFSTSVYECKGARQQLKPTDILEGVWGIVNVKIASPKFSNQVKHRLVDDRATQLIQDQIMPILAQWIKTNKDLVRKLLDKAIRLKELSDKFNEDKKQLKALKTTVRGKEILPSKLIRCTSKNPEDIELFLLEGESAGGCFLGKTPITLEDGRIISFEDMAVNELQGEVFTSIGYDLVKKNFVPIPLEEPRIVKYTKDLVEVEFDDGTFYTCTPDHLWLLQNEEYVAALDLIEGDELKVFQEV